MNPNEQTVEQSESREFEPSSHEYLQSLQKYAVVLRSSRIELLTESLDLIEVIQKAEELGYKTGNIGQIRYSGFSQDEGILRMRPQDLNHEVGIISHNDKDYVTYLLIKGVGRVRF